jgi:ABC-2 type transport system ATP-binding protein
VAGQAREIDITATPRVRAAGLLAAVPTVSRAAEHNGGIRVTLSPEAPVDREIVTEILGRLLADGIAVERVAPVTSSLEDLFLDMTTRLEDRA